MTARFQKKNSWMDVSAHALGRKGEKIALDLLQKKKFQILKQNFRMFQGEIDLIANDGDDLVFIEVKSRRGYQFGHPEDSVTPSKQNQIKKIAEGYLHKNNIQNRPCRFDVIAVTFLDDRVEVTHFEDAFN
jgi:putative endonuclease